MELKSTEQEVTSLYDLYIHTQTECSTLPIAVHLPKLPDTSSSVGSSSLDEQHQQQQHDDTTTTTTPALLLKMNVENMSHRMETLRPIVTKFQQRLSQVDPVTNQPRYGTQTATRVKKILVDYAALDTVLQSETIGEVLDLLQTLVDEDERHRQAALRAREEQEQATERERAAAAAEEQRIQEQRRIESEQRQQEAARLLSQQLVGERRMEEEREAADRAWVASIPRTLESVRKYLHMFRETKGSLASLEMIYSQILAHPEEDKFRRIRRDHPKFMEDIGQYPGGKEILIASGFNLGMVEEVPSFVCREPNVEVDLDGWTEWYDLLKGTLSLVQQERM